ncbi:hypothetical protein BKI52_32865 [marine bacterium AO1-C]|nr:hypothetical protein BKI52_32865 [marine bacterium AO1-C]
MLSSYVRDLGSLKYGLSLKQGEVDKNLLKEDLKTLKSKIASAFSTGILSIDEAFRKIENSEKLEPNEVIAFLEELENTLLK